MLALTRLAELDSLFTLCWCSLVGPKPIRVARRQERSKSFRLIALELLIAGMESGESLGNCKAGPISLLCLPPIPVRSIRGRRCLPCHP